MDKVQGTKHVFWKYFNFAIKVPERKLSKNYDKNYANEFLFCEDKNNFYGVLCMVINSNKVYGRVIKWMRFFKIQSRVVDGNCERLIVPNGHIKMQRKTQRVVMC